MMRLTIIQVGKTKDPAVLALLDEYTRRIKSSFSLDVITCKDEAGLWGKTKEGVFTILLDAAGKSLDSPSFARLLHDLPVRGHSHVQILIGPPEGFTRQEKKPDLLLSLSAMTFSHQTIRLLLYEQIYRAATILEGKPFAK